MMMMMQRLALVVKLRKIICLKLQVLDPGVLELALSVLYVAVAFTSPLCEALCAS